MKKTRTQTNTNKHTEEQKLTELRLEKSLLSSWRTYFIIFSTFRLIKKHFPFLTLRGRSLLIFQLNLLYQQVKNQVRHARQNYRRSTACNNN